MLETDFEKKKDNKKKLYVLEMMKWFSIVTLFIITVFGNYLYRHYSVILRGVLITCIVFVIIYMISSTRTGKLFLIFGQESYIELKQVVWPTYRDGLNTTFIVVGVTVLVSLVLWGLDAIVVHVISFGLRL